MIRVLHTADLHLGKVFSNDDEKFSRLRRKEQMALFASIMMYARSQKADILLFAGDVLDGISPDAEIRDLVKREFENTPHTEIFVSPGRNDAAVSGSFWRDGTFPENVHVFKSERVERVDLDRLNASVYGYAFCHRSPENNPFAVIPPTDKSRCNLFCGVGSTANDNFGFTVSKEEIAHSGIDYIALGGDHQPSELLREGQTYYALSGCPEGLSFDDTGAHSVRLVAMEKSEGSLLLQSKCVSLSARHFERLFVTLNNAASLVKAEEAVAEYIRTKGADKDCFLELVLEGTVRLSFRAPAEAFMKVGDKLGYLKITDRTTMLYEDTGKEDFKAIFAKKVAEKTEEGELRSDVLKCGFEALEHK